MFWKKNTPDNGMGEEALDHRPQAMLRPMVEADLYWLLGALCQFHRIPFDPSLIAQQFPPPATIATLHESARAMGLSTRSMSWSPPPPSSPSKWHFPLPAILFLKEEEESVPPDSHTSPLPPRLTAPVLLVKWSEEEAIYFRPGSGTPETLPAATLRVEPEAILVERMARDHGEKIAGFKQDEKTFGFRWFLPELLRHKAIWRDVLVASFAIQLVGLATPLFTQVIIDKVVVHQTHSTLLVLGVALIMFMIFTSLMTWMRQYLVLHTGNRIDAVLGSQVFRHMLHLPMAYFENRPTGTLVARLQGVETIREFITGAAVGLVLDLPFLLVFLAVMFHYSWQLSLIAVGVLTLVGIISLFMVPLFRERMNRQFMLGARNQAFLTEYVAGMSTVKALQMEPDVNRRYGDFLAQFLAAGFNSRQVGNTYNVVANTLEQAMTLAILFVGALQVMNNDGFTVGMLVAFQMFASRMSQPLMRLVGLWQEFQQADIAVKRLGDILDMPQEPHAVTPSREGGGQGRIDLTGLGFRYSEKHPWLYRHLQLSLPPGKLAALMGPSGSGKSTLAKLLLGFYQPQEGQIKLDGRDIRTLAANELRSAFGVVPQETTLFSGTVYDNLAMASPKSSFQEIIAACKAAEIHEVIEQLPNGYQTELGENGTGLSGGQKQRIAIARALLKRPRILLFDEAVSSLDAPTSEQFANTINTLKGKVTILFITHQIPRGLQVDEAYRLGSPRQAAPASEGGEGSMVK